ncbi:MAG: ATP-binding cassette domain-containing protein [Bacilli bacterium]
MAKEEKKVEKVKEVPSAEVQKTHRTVLSCPKDAYVSLQHIDKIYDNGVQAVFDFNLDVKKHEFIVFVGPSGCGKSTTLRMIAGLENITSGHLFIDGEYVNDVTPKDRNIAMVFQSYALYPHMTVFDNMAYSLKINKAPTKVLTEQSKEQINALEKELNNEFNNFRKINKRRDNLEKIHSERENAQRDYESIKDAKKKDKFGKYIAKLDTKLVDYDKVNKEAIEYDKKIEALSSKLKAAKDKAVYQYDIDHKRAAYLEKQIEKAEKEGDTKKLPDLREQLKTAQTTKVPVVQLKHISKNEINRRVHEAARILQIEQYLDRKPKALSGGQRQRVALGRAIVRNAKVFLMDEPLSNLDAKLRVQMRSEIVRLHNQLNATTIYVTHDQTEAMTMATRIVIMKLGHIQQIGTPIEIYNHPSNLFVAGFIGSPAMNFFKVKFDKGTITFDNGDKIKVPTKIYKDKNIPSEAIIGIRPENIHNDKGEHAKEFPDAIVELKVKVAELLGNEYYVHADFAGKELVCKMEANQTINVGDKIKVCFNLNKLHFFDVKTEKAI